MADPNINDVIARTAQNLQSEQQASVASADMAPLKKLYLDDAGTPWVNDGKWRQATHDEIINATINDSADQKTKDALQMAQLNAEGFEPDTMGGGVGERIVGKWLASDTDALERWYKARGYETKRLPTSYGANLNLAIKKPGLPWRPIDPRRSLDPFEIIRDLVDMIPDVPSALAIGTATTTGGMLGGMAGGVPGAIGGAMAGGGLSSGAIEAGREALGSLAGIPGNISPSQIGTQGAVGAVMGPVAPQIERLAGAGLTAAGRGIRAGMRAGGKLQREMSGTMIGLSRKGSFDVDELMATRAAEKAKTLPELRSPAKKIAQFFIKLQRHEVPYPEKVAATQMEADSLNHGVTVNMRPMMDRIMEDSAPSSTDAMIRSEKDKGLTESAKSLAETMDSLLQLEGRKLGPHPGNLRWEQVPVPVAVELKRFLQGAARGDADIKNALARLSGKNAYATGDMDFFKKLTSEAGAQARSAIRDAMSPAYPDYNKQMLGVEFKESLRKDFGTALGIGKKEIPRDELKRQTNLLETRIEQYLNSYYGDAKAGGRAMMKELEDAYGVNFTDEIKKAVTGIAFGHEGELGWRPKLSATGRWVNIFTASGLGAGAGISAASGHPVIAAGIGGLGMALASPKAQVGATRLLSLLGRSVDAAGVGSANFAARKIPTSGFTSQIALDIARSATVSSDEKPKRKPTVIR